MSKKSQPEEKRFKASTKIAAEVASSNNPYVAEKINMAGYDLIDLAQKASFSDILFLLFTGELPKTVEAKKLLEALVIMLSLPSPRHPAARAAMNAGICKANAEHLLPISLLSLGGEQSGAQEVAKCYQFIQQNREQSVESAGNRILKDWQREQEHIAPGFGQIYGSIDPLSHSFLEQLLSIKPEAKTLRWTKALCDYLNLHNAGILDVGVASCVFLELSFSERECIGLYQLLRAPGLLAYAMEQTHKPISAIPMLQDDQYELI